MFLLDYLGAEVTGFSDGLLPGYSLFAEANIGSLPGLKSVFGDVRDLSALEKAQRECGAELVIHMAAQPLVRRGYQDPVTTYGTNVMGTVNLLDAVRRTESVHAAIIVTSDKCYESRETVSGYRESDRLGGSDPYASSKACSELVSQAYIQSYFEAENRRDEGTLVASVRSGNVVGGGDWAVDRLIPDLVRSAMAATPAKIRNPGSIRPWQHVIEPLIGYLMLADRLVAGDRAFSGPWNFGTAARNDVSVREVADRFVAEWGDGAAWSVDDRSHVDEVSILRLDSTRSREMLGWEPRWPFHRAIAETIGFYKQLQMDPKGITEFAIAQIDSYRQRVEPVSGREMQS